MTGDLKEVLKELDDKITEVYDLDLAEEMTDIYVDLVDSVDVMSKEYWKLVKTLATIEKQRDEERKLRENVEKERDQALYDKNYYRNELDREIESRRNVDFQKNYLMNMLTGCVDCKGCEFCQ